MSNEPKAFFCYATRDNEGDRGYLVNLCNELSGEVGQLLGEDFPIFQDVEGIGLGENRAESSSRAIGKSTFLIPILTPSFFNSDYCRGQVQQFLEIEKKRERNEKCQH